jgi:hypothetical protein
VLKCSINPITDPKPDYNHSKILTMLFNVFFSYRGYMSSNKLGCKCLALMLIIIGHIATMKCRHLDVIVESIVLHK